jgi:hypothetical protein
MSTKKREVIFGGSRVTYRWVNATAGAPPPPPQGHEKTLPRSSGTRPFSTQSLAGQVSLRHRFVATFCYFLSAANRTPGNDSTCFDGEQARLPVMRFEVAGDPATLVEKDDGRRFLPRDAIDPRRQPHLCRQYLHLVDVLHLRRRNISAGGCERAECIARTLRCHRVWIAQR